MQRLRTYTVDEDTYTRIPRDVAQTLEIAASLGFVVDDEIEVFVIVRKSDGDDVGPALRVGRGESRHARIVEPQPHSRRIHPRKYR